MKNRARESDGAAEYIEELCLEYCDEAAPLWYMRCNAAKAPHYDLTDLLALDNRLEAQIDALRVAGETGWECCKAALERGDAGEYFFASVPAFESADEARIAFILDKAASSPELSEGVISALGWLSWEQSEPHIMNLVKSKKPELQYIGISASALHRRDLDRYLDDAVYSPDLRIRALALRAMGEFGGRKGIMMSGRLQDRWSHKDELIRYYSSRSSVLLNYAGVNTGLRAIDVLRTFVRPGFPHCEEAMQIALRHMEPGEALKVQRELAGSADGLRLAVQGAGIIGDPVLVPWLLEQMRIPEPARVAGEALTMITGVDIEREGMAGQCPEGFSAGPNDDPDDPNVELDPDENLPWPNVELIAVWWDKNKGKYPGGKRLLLGRPITKEHAASVLKTGLQRQRAAAALELAILEPGKPLYDVCSPVRRQIPAEAKTTTRPAPVKINYGKRELAVTAVNSITPVGLDACMTAASVRAGITRLAFYDEYQDAGCNPITIAKIKGINIVKEDIAERLGEFAKICLDDLLNEYFQNISEQKRPFQGHILLGVASEKRPAQGNYADEIMSCLYPALGYWVAQTSGEVVEKGNVSLHHSIKKAAQYIASNPDALCVIGGVDSLLSESTLNWFDADNRLKSESYGRHQGLSPSEAVCFLIVEDFERARQAKRPILARISSLGLAQEPNPRASDKSGIYTGLTEACQAAMEPLKDRELKAVFGDFNGEESRAVEWTIAAMRSFRNPPGPPPVWRPAVHYGDIGAASGAVMAGIAAQGFTRNWLESPVMIFCSDDHGPCGALVLEKEE
jgi:3-oxoacyl-[acyl-carrier-protein] synthase I